MLKKISKYIIYHTSFCPTHIGQYLREKYFFKYLNPLPIKSFQNILDAGCGSGDYSIKFAKKYPWVKIIGYDVKKFDSWKKSPGNVQLKQQNLLNISEENRYDFCFSIDTLEHIPNNYKVIKKLYKSLKPGGYFYLHMPSQNQCRILPKKLFKKTEKRLQKEHIGQMYGLKEIKDVLKAIGFKIVKTRHTFGFWGELAWEFDRMTDKKRWIKIILMPLVKAFAQIDYWLPKTNGNGFLVISRK